MPSLHVGALDSEGKHIARAKVRLVGVGPANIGSQSIDTTLGTGFDGVASFNFGDFANGAVQIHADVTTPKGKTASKDITDAVAPVVRPDINYDITVADSKEGNALADLATRLGEYKNVLLVGGAVLAGIGLYLSERKRQREEAKRQQELLMMFALRAPQETAQVALQNGGALEKKKKALPTPQARLVKLVKKAVKK